MLSPLQGESDSDPTVESPVVMRLRAEVRTFLKEQRAESRFRPECNSWMSSFSPEFSRALGARGWIGMTWPTEYGGSARTQRERLALIEELLVAGAPISAHWFADRQIGPALLKHGSEGQRQRYLPLIARGECYFAIGMSEPDSGSDLASVRTAAVRTSDGWQLNGTKVWTSHAHHAHYMLALVRTSPKNPGDRHAGLSQFIVDLSAPGVHVRPIRSLDGGHHFNEVILEEVRVAEDALLGQEGEGWQQVTAELAYERSGPERFLSTIPLLFEVVRRTRPAVDPEVGLLFAELQALRSLSGRVSDALELGNTPAIEAAVVKDLGTRFEQKVIDVARRVSPSEPDLASTDDLSRLLAEAVVHSPDATLRGGTNEILRGIISRDLVRS